MPKIKQRQEALIREYASKGYSANRIQIELSRQGLGIRRKDLLAYVRELRGIAAPAYPQKYVPVRAIERRRARAKAA